MRRVDYMTNVQMLMELDRTFKPENNPFLSEQEVAYLREFLGIDSQSKTMLDMCNLRDTTVLLWTCEDISRTTMSAVTAVIDWEMN